MRNKGSRKWSVPRTRAIKIALLSTLILTACQTVGSVPVPTSQDRTSKPLACADFAPMTFSAGKPGVTAKDVRDALDQHTADPLPWVRNLVGDTMATRREVSDYAAARKAICC